MRRAYKYTLINQYVIMDLGIYFKDLHMDLIPGNRKYDRSIKTRQAILKAAKNLFVKKGYSGTSMSDIAKYAKVNQSLIHHHFGSKKALWYAVRDRLYERYFEASNQFFANNSDQPESQLKAILQMRFEFLKQHPEVARFLSWQNLNELPVDLNQETKMMVELVMSRLLKAQKASKIRQDIDIRMLAAMVFIITAGWFEYDYDWLIDEKGQKVSKETLDKQFFDTLVKVFLQGAMIV